MCEYGQATDKETLELIVRYLKIKDPDGRRQIFDLADQYASEGSSLIFQDNSRDKTF